MMHRLRCFVFPYADPVATKALISGNWHSNDKYFKIKPLTKHFKRTPDNIVSMFDLGLLVDFIQNDNCSHSRG